METMQVVKKSKKKWALNPNGKSPVCKVFSFWPTSDRHGISLADFSQSSISLAAVNTVR
jgi:hypothetical protein